LLTAVNGSQAAVTITAVTIDARFLMAVTVYERCGALLLCAAYVSQRAAALVRVPFSPHHMLMSLDKPEGSVLGAIEVGVFVSSVLYGAACVQTYTYAHSRAAQDNRWWFKLIVSALWSVCLGMMVISAHRPIGC
jgi:hypothetical protein